MKSLLDGHDHSAWRVVGLNTITDAPAVQSDGLDINTDWRDGSRRFDEGPSRMITAAQLRAARALLGIDQQTLADLAGVSLPTIQRMEASQGNVRGVVDTLTKVVEALNRSGVELIADNARSDGRGRGVRMREPEQEQRTTTPSALKGRKPLDQRAKGAASRQEPRWKLSSDS